MTEIKGTTKVCGLIGNPVAHSISPVIHNNLAELCGIDLVYETFKVENDLVADAVKGAYALNIQGLNVTVPHKQKVMEVLKDIAPLAEAIGAVNTLVRVEGGYKGYNTDILGLERELEDAGIEISGRDVIILGAGGASRAIAFLCADKGAENVYLFNRTLEKAELIADAVNRHFKKDIVTPYNIKDYSALAGNEYIAIQTTSVGLHPNDDEAVIESADFYEKLAAGVDVIYNPVKTKFMKLVEAQGKPAYNGLKMLLYQGIASFELWNNITVSKEQVDIVYDRMKRELGIVE